ncbi:transcriptional regulator, partial [Klebsiella pneumoniae]|nr:transcriptional regulator [Klebsiella pneumoniae]
PRLTAVFPLMLRVLDLNTEQSRKFAQEMRQVISAVTESIEAGTLRLEIRIDGQHPGARPGAWY